MSSYFLLSLPNQDNDYQRHQAAAAEDAARRAGVRLKVVYADGDALKQSEQILSEIQASNREARPNGVIVQCIGTELRSVAELAVGSGIGWAVLHRDYDYPPHLRTIAKAPLFALSSDHIEEGRIQGRQLAKLIPNGGVVLNILGPSGDKIATLRSTGLEQTKPSNIEIRTVRGRWTMQSGKDAVNVWLRISTSLQTPLAAIISQNDDMAMGARSALQESIGIGEKFASVPLLGIDGVPDAGQTWVKKGLLAATVCLSPLAGVGVTMLADALKSGKNPPENSVFNAESFPKLDHLRG